MNAQLNEVRASIAEGCLRLNGVVSQRGANVRVGYQVRDSGSESVLEDGEFVDLPAGSPQDAVEFETSISLPREDGRYTVLVSPFRPGRTFMGHRKASVAAVRVIVSDGTASIVEQSLTTPGGLRFRQALLRLRRAATYPFQTIWRNRSLIRSMVRRDIAGRYAGSHAGVFWTIIHPLLMMLTYAFVFGVVLRTRFVNDDRPSSFVLYFLAGMLPWLPFSEAAGRASTIVVEHANFVKKIVFPVDILPVNVVFAGLFSQMFAIAIFFVALVAFGRDIHGTVIYLPLLLIPQVLFTLGASWLLAALGVLFRDLGQLMGFVITVWFFLTPICYDGSALPSELGWLFEKNPFYVLVGAYRAVLLENAAPAWGPLAWLTAASALICLLGYGWFHRMRRQFADLV